MLSGYKSRITLGGAIFIGAALTGNSAMGALIADLQADFQWPVPKAGWSYERNPAGVNIGDRSNYVLLQPDSGNLNHYGADATNPGWPDASPGAYTIFAGAALTHPGNGSTQVPDGFDHYMISHYTLTTSGPTFLENLAVSTNGGGVDVWYAVNSGPGTLLSAFSGTPISVASISLGTLSAGDSIYVALGPHTGDGNDSSNFQYQITQTPEPASAAIACLAGGATLLRRRRICR